MRNSPGGLRIHGAPSWTNNPTGHKMHAEEPQERAWESHVAHENAIPTFWRANVFEAEAGFNWKSWFLFRSWAWIWKLGNNTWCWSLRPGTHVLGAIGKYVKNAAWYCRNYLECSHADGSGGNNQLIEDLVDWPEPWLGLCAMEHRCARLSLGNSTGATLVVPSVLSVASMSLTVTFGQVWIFGSEWLAGKLLEDNCSATNWIWTDMLLGNDEAWTTS